MLPWDHNAYYHRLLLRSVPRGAYRVLAVGCGAGQLACQLAGLAEQVDAIDRDPAMISAASTVAPANVTYLLADVMDTVLAPNSYDAVVSMSALRHLPLVPALSRLAAALRPGGTLAAEALPRRDLPRELPIELAATTWHDTVGLALTATGYRGHRQLRHGPDHDAMPIRDPDLTTRQVREQARGALPAADVHRLLWRYLLVWHKPGAANHQPGERSASAPATPPSTPSATPELMIMGSGRVRHRRVRPAHAGPRSAAAEA